ncbi:MAG: translation initiation factor IF-2, partial [Prevotellaceae bacterium]|nr:translation initiation factor IF-2 [Prevotellaceae bacterium]
PGASQHVATRSEATPEVHHPAEPVVRAQAEPVQMAADIPTVPETAPAETISESPRPETAIPEPKPAASETAEAPEKPEITPEEPEAAADQAPTPGAAATPSAQEPQAAETQYETPAVGETTDSGVFRYNTAAPLTGPKVLGKVDLDSINASTRPKKKSKEELRRERTKVAAGSTTAGQPGKKKKRSRIGEERVDINAAANQPQAGGRGNQQPGQPQSTKKKKRKQEQPVVKAEISDEDVARQVRETLARLQGKTKGAKGAKYRKEKRDQVRAQQEEQFEQAQAESKVLKLTEFVTANELATMMDVPVTKVIGTCMSIGIMISINQRMDAETIDLVAEEFGFKTEYVSAEVQDAIAEEVDAEEDLRERAPIVTVMGHVDHGKTSLLDYIRKANVIAGEAGGITQHIGAYNVTLESGRHITFLDTPGHEAFTAMRARGAQVTDIAIIIIAADDDIMPQTKEAISHAVAAGVPIVFAINKVDKPAANPDKIKEGLAQMNFLVEEWGGKYQSQDISAKKGTGVKELLEKVLLEADMLELKANPDRKAVGTVIESSLDKGRGYVATVLVSSGTLRQGDIVLAGTNYGRVKALFNERNARVQEIGPSMAATLLGFNGAPQAGDQFHVMETEQEAREIATKREQLQREQSLRTQKMLTLEEIGRRIKAGSYQELNLVVKGDVDGSVEALSDSFIKLSTETIVVNVIHKGVGQISENDVTLAAASQAIIVGFQVRPSKSARALADKEGVEIRQYSIIYDAIEEVKEAMEGMLKPIVKEEMTATVEVRQVYHISKVGYVAGAYVIDGKVQRSNKARLIRDGIVIFTGDIAALKRFKDDVKEVTTNFECGISLQGCNDIKEGDLIETFQEVEIKQKL